MKIYLVGGAVRDLALGLEVKERDWVVVGGVADDLLRQGYKQVGRDFPVFLHPKTKEEYALARRERKVKPGYTGFICEFDSTVTLEEDLARRDLTINAIAMDEQGQWIDPYGGLADLKNKCLRHVSSAFVEDPVRVLRVARFAARFAHLGFKVAAETRRLIYSMRKNHELESLVPERVWREWQRSLTEPQPAQFIQVLRETGAISQVLCEISRLFGVPRLRVNQQMIVDVGEASIQRLAHASQSTDDPIVRFSVFCLDIGKAGTSPCYWPFHPDEKAQGALLLSMLCERLKIPNAYYALANLALKLYDQIVRLHELTAQQVLEVLTDADAWRRAERFMQLLQVCEIAYQGRPFSSAWQNLQENTRQAYQSLGEYQGIQLKEAIANARLKIIQQQLKHWKDNEK